MKTTLQKLGKSLSAMVMPNIGAFIAWGFITALFIADGWLPNEQLASIQPYMLTYLLPVLIAATGGRMVGGDRGLVMGGDCDYWMYCRCWWNPRTTYVDGSHGYGTIFWLGN